MLDRTLTLPEYPEELRSFTARLLEEIEAQAIQIGKLLADKGIALRSGALVDATIIDAPSSTKNKAGARDPEMSSTK
jgi:hypothetical protein